MSISNMPSKPVLSETDKQSIKELCSETEIAIGAILKKPSLIALGALGIAGAANKEVKNFSLGIKQRLLILPCKSPTKKWVIYKGVIGGYTVITVSEQLGTMLNILRRY